jgi:hypothetical protein
VWAETVRVHGLAGRIGPDGTDRDLTVGGPVDEIASYVAELRALGISEAVFIFRAPFDLETIGRIGEVRAALASIRG